MSKTCDHIIAYNGYQDIVEAEVAVSTLCVAIKEIKQELRDWLKHGKGRTDCFYTDNKKLLETGTTEELLSKHYVVSKHCPRCGIKISLEEMGLGHV